MKIIRQWMLKSEWFLIIVNLLIVKSSCFEGRRLVLAYVDILRRFEYGSLVLYVLGRYYSLHIRFYCLPWSLAVGIAYLLGLCLSIIIEGGFEAVWIFTANVSALALLLHLHPMRILLFFLVFILCLRVLNLLVLSKVAQAIVSYHVFCRFHIFQYRLLEFLTLHWLLNFSVCRLHGIGSDFLMWEFFSELRFFYLLRFGLRGIGWRDDSGFILRILCSG